MAWFSGSTYSAPYQTTNGLALNNPSITLSGGDLAAEVSDPVSLIGQILSDGGQEFDADHCPGQRELHLPVYRAGRDKEVTGAGVVLQNQGVARGFFLGANQSGSVLLYRQYGGCLVANGKWLVSGQGRAGSPLPTAKRLVASG